MGERHNQFTTSTSASPISLGSRVPPLRGFLGTSDWETLGQTQNTLEGLYRYIPSEQGTLQDPIGGAGECCWGGRLGGPVYPAATATRPQISGREWMMDGWI